MMKSGKRGERRATRFTWAAAMSLLLALTVVLSACGGTGKGDKLRINVPEETLFVDVLGSFSLPKYDVVDGEGVVKAGYTVAVKQIVDPQGNVSGPANAIMADGPGIWKVTYAAKGVADAVLTVDIADRTAPTVEVTSTLQQYYVYQREYSKPKWTTADDDSDWDKCYDQVYYRASEDAERQLVVDKAGNNFTIENETGYYDIVIYVVDKAGNDDTWVYSAPVSPFKPADDQIFLFDQPDGLQQIHKNRDHFDAEFVETVEDTGLTNMTKIVVTSDAVGNSLYMMNWKTPVGGSNLATKYPFVKFYFYNPNDFDMRVGVRWHSDTTVFKKSGRWLVWNTADLISQSTDWLSNAHDDSLNGLALRFAKPGWTDLPKGAVFYFGGVYGVHASDVRLEGGIATDIVTTAGSPFEIKLPTYSVNCGSEDAPEWVAPGAGAVTNPFLGTIRLESLNDAGGGGLTTSNNTYTFTEDGNYSVTYKSSLIGSLSKKIEFSVKVVSPRADEIYAFDSADGVYQFRDTKNAVSAEFVASATEGGKTLTDMTKFRVYGDLPADDECFRWVMPLQSAGYPAIKFYVYNPNAFSLVFSYCWGGDTEIAAGTGKWLIWFPADTEWCKVGPNQELMLRIKKREGGKNAAVPQGSAFYVGGVYGVHAEDISMVLPADTSTMLGEWTVPSALDMSGNNKVNYRVRVSDTVTADAVINKVYHPGEVTVRMTDENGKEIPITDGKVQFTRNGVYTLTYSSGFAGIADGVMTVTVDDWSDYDWKASENEIFVLDDANSDHAFGSLKDTLQFTADQSVAGYEHLLQVTYKVSGVSVYDFWELLYPQQGVITPERYPFVKFFVYNPNDFRMRVGLKWHSDTYVEPRSGKWIVFSVADLLNGGQAYDDKDVENTLKGLSIRVGQSGWISMPSDSSFYIGSIYGIPANELMLTAANDSLDIVDFGNGYALPSASYTVTDAASQFGNDSYEVRWNAAANAKYTTVPRTITAEVTGSGGKVRVEGGKAYFTEAGTYTITYRSDYPGVAAKEITLNVSMPAERREDTVLYADEEFGVKQIDNWAGNYSAEYTTEKAYGSEAGSIRITAGDAAEFGVKIAAPHLKDLSGYKYLVLHIFNSHTKSVRLGLAWWHAYRLLPGQWSTIYVPTSVFTQTNEKGGKLISEGSLTDVTGLPLRFRNNEVGAAGAVYYIGSIGVANAYENEFVDTVENRAFAFDTAAGVEKQLLVMENGFSAEFCEAVPDTEYTDMTRFTWSSDGNDYREYQAGFYQSGILDVRGYDYISFDVYNPNAYDITLSNAWGPQTTVAAGTKVTVKWEISTKGGAIAYGANQTVLKNAAADFISYDLDGLTFMLRGSGIKNQAPTIYVGGVYCGHNA